MGSLTWSLSQTAALGTFGKMGSVFHTDSHLTGQPHPAPRYDLGEKKAQGFLAKVTGGAWAPGQKSLPCHLAHVSTKYSQPVTCHPQRRPDLEGSYHRPILQIRTRRLELNEPQSFSPSPILCSGYPWLPILGQDRGWGPHTRHRRSWTERANEVDWVCVLGEYKVGRTLQGFILRAEPPGSQ